METRHVTLHGHAIGYRMAGQGPVIVLLHGLAGSSRTWLEVMPLLARDYTVVAPDLLGHGDSAKPPGDYSLGAYAASLRDLLVGPLGIERATFVGHSLGGGVAMQVAYQHPELCERMVLAASGGLGREVSWVLRLFTLPGAEYLMPALFPRFARDLGDRFQAFLRNRGVRAPRIEEGWRAYASLGEAESRRAFLRTLCSVVDAKEGQAVSARDRLYLAAALPTLILWGDRDAILPVSHAHAARELVPGSRLEIFEGAGHFLHVEQPLRFAETVRAFIAGTEPGRTEPDVYREMLLARGTQAGTFLPNFRSG